MTHTGDSRYGPPGIEGWKEEPIGGFGRTGRAVQPCAIAAAMQLIAAHNWANDERHKLLELQDVEYEAQRAYRQDDQVDPENRFEFPAFLTYVIASAPFQA
jgi:hypothetical protein